jgi:hypothetical protein
MFSKRSGGFPELWGAFPELSEVFPRLWETVPKLWEAFPGLWETVLKLRGEETIITFNLCGDWLMLEIMQGGSRANGLNFSL